MWTATDCLALLLDLEGTIVDLNQPMAAGLGNSVEQLKGTLVWHYMAPENRVRLQESFRNVVESGKPQLVGSGCNGRWHESLLLPCRGEEGKVIGVSMVSHDTTDQTTEKRTLIDNETRLRNVIEATQAGTWEWNLQTGETIFNNRWAEILGYSLAELAPVSIRTWLELAHPEDLKESEVRLAKVFANPELYYDCECRMKHRNGDWVWVHNRGKVVEWTSAGRPLRMAGTHTDITCQKRLQAALRDSEQRYRTVVEDQTEIISRFDADGTFTFVNEVYCRFFGKSREELVGQKWFPRAVSSDLAGIEAKLQALAPDNPVVVIRNRVYDANNEVRWMEFVNRGFFNSHGQLVETQSVGRDITEAKLAQERVEESEKQFVTFFQCNPAAAAIGSLETQKFVEVNGAFAEMYGYEPGEVVGRTAAELGIWPLPEQRTAMIQVLQRHGRVQGFEAKYRKKSGEIGDLIMSAAIIDIAGARHVVGMVLDVTQRRLMEEQLRQSDALQRTILTAMADGVVYLDADGTLLSCNASAERILGLNRDQMLGRTSLDPRWGSVHEDGTEFPGQDHPVMVSLRTGRSLRDIVMGINLQEGARRWISINSEPLFRPGENQPYAAIASFSDITTRKQTEERLRQSQKMEAVGHLAGGIAHQFNNILASMMMNLSLASLQGEGEEQQQALHDLEDSCKRSADLVKQLLAFSRQSVMDRQVLSVAELVRRQADILGVLLGERIKWEIVVPDGLPATKADKVLIEQVVLNLCLNARDAMRQGGTLRLELALENVEAERGKTQCEARPGQFLRLSITDTGCGMDDVTLGRLFEPFFSTKEVGQGTGLGLATVRGIVQQHQGWVEVKSAPGQGSTFSVYLPPAEAIQPAIPAAQPRKVIPGGNTLLVVEDDEKLRRLTKQLLTRHGYRVHEATDGATALAMWAEHRDDIDLLFTDMVLPGLWSGLQLAERFHSVTRGRTIASHST